MKKGLLVLAVLVALLVLVSASYVSLTSVRGSPESSRSSGKSQVATEFSRTAPVSAVENSISRSPLSLQDEHALRARNHSSLLRAQKEIRQVRQADPKDKVASVTKSVREWGRTLYMDAVISAIIRMETTHPSRASLMSRLEDSVTVESPDFLAACLPVIDESYSHDLGDAVLVALSDASHDPAAAQSMVPRLSRLIDLRKRLSDNYFKSQIRGFITSNANPLDKKLDYMKTFCDTGDQSLVHFSSEYFLDLTTNATLTSEQSQRIETIFGKFRRK